MSGRPSIIEIYLFNTTSGQPFSNLDTVHERIMHTFIISGDFETFAHIHPEDFADSLQSLARKDEGLYFINYSFPKPGRYVILLDYTISGRTVQRLFTIDVRGSETIGGERAYTDGYTVWLLNEDSVEAVKEASLDFYIEKDGKPVRDLQLLLGSEIHTVFLRKDLQAADHTHAYIPGHFVHFGERPQKYFGPTIPVRYTFTQPGDYAVFSQFKHNGTVITSQFLLKVKETPFQVIVTWGMTIAYSASMAAIGIWFLYDYLKKRGEHRKLLAK